MDAGLAARVSAALCSGERLEVADVGCWSLAYRCRFRAGAPRLPPAGEAAHDAFGRPRYTSGSWYEPTFRFAPRLRERVLAAVEPPGSGDWPQELAIRMRRGECVALEGVGHFVLSRRERPGLGRLPTFRYDTDFRRLIADSPVAAVTGRPRG